VVAIGQINFQTRRLIWQRDPHHSGALSLRLLLSPRARGIVLVPNKQGNDMTKLSDEIHVRTVQLSNEDLDKVSGGRDSIMEVQWPKHVMADKSAAANDALIRQ
jgi:hypothetical protein